MQRQAALAGGVKAEAKVKSEQVGAAVAGAAARGGGKQAHTAHTSQPKAAPKEANGRPKRNVLADAAKIRQEFVAANSDDKTFFVFRSGPESYLAVACEACGGF